MPRESRSWLDWGWLAFWGVLSTAWCISAGHSLGPTFDEQFYVQAGLTNWHNLNHRELLTQGTMPLPAEVQTLALRLAEVFGTADPATDWVEWLPIARVGTMLFWWALLWGSFDLAWQYGGGLAARLAVALVACEPILLGHASLATTDVPFTATLVCLLAVFRARRDAERWHARLLVPGVWFMLTFMTKASAILYTPVCLALIELERLWSVGWRPWRTTLSPGNEQRTAWTAALASLRDLVLLAVLGTVCLFVVCPRCTRGLLFQIRYQSTVWNGETYLLGEYSDKGFPHYFAAALAIKLALPVLVLIAVSFLVRPRSAWNGALLAALGLLVITPIFRTQTGVRYVLPIAALALVGASAAYGRWWSEQSAGWRRIAAGTFAFGLVCWSAACSWTVWPNGICYVNELFGGTRNGHLALTESNIDWGQGLNELAQWHRESADVKLHLWYFGVDPRSAKPPFYPICPHDWTHGEDVAKWCNGGYLAASKSYVYGYYHSTPAARFLRSLEPCDQTSTYLIFDFRESGNASAKRR